MVRRHNFHDTTLGSLLKASSGQVWIAIAISRDKGPGQDSSNARVIFLSSGRDENLHVASSKPMRIWQGIFEITVSSRQHKTFTTALCATQKPYPPRFDRIFNASNSGSSSPMTSLNVFSRHDAKASRGLVDAYTLTVI